MSQLQSIMRECSDMERSLQRLVLGKGNSRDLSNISKTLSKVATLNDAFTRIPKLPVLLQKHVNLLHPHMNIVEELTKALREELPLAMHEGGYIRAGYNQQLDDLRNLKQDTHQVLTSLQTKYRHTTNINTLKIKHNHIVGIHIEIPPSHKDKAPQYFKLIQQTQSSLKYKTDVCSMCRYFSYFLRNCMHWSLNYKVLHPKQLH